MIVIIKIYTKNDVILGMCSNAADARFEVVGSGQKSGQDESTPYRPVAMDMDMHRRI